MLVAMNRSRYGSADGFAVKRFEKDKVYNIPDSLARQFIQLQAASPAAPSVEQLLLAKKVLGLAAAGAPIDSVISIFQGNDLIKVAYFIEEIAEILSNAPNHASQTPDEMYHAALSSKHQIHNPTTLQTLGIDLTLKDGEAHV